MLSTLHWLLVSFRIDFKILLFVFKSLHGLAPLYVSDLIKVHRPSRALRSADQMLLDVPRSNRKSRGDRAFAVVAPTLWNALPLTVRSATSLSSFKSLLKTHLFSIAFDWVGSLLCEAVCVYLSVLTCCFVVAVFIWSCKALCWPSVCLNVLYK